MEYKVKPFVASISANNGSDQAAIQLESLINNMSSQGWKYVRLESVTTFVQPENGCFGLGGKPGYSTSYQMVVFGK